MSRYEVIRSGKGGQFVLARAAGGVFAEMANPTISNIASAQGWILAEACTNWRAHDTAGRRAIVRNWFTLTLGVSGAEVDATGRVGRATNEIDTACLASGMADITAATLQSLRDQNASLTADLNACNTERLANIAEVGRLTNVLDHCNTARTQALADLSQCDTERTARTTERDTCVIVRDACIAARDTALARVHDLEAQVATLTSGGDHAATVAQQLADEHARLVAAQAELATTKQAALACETKPAGISMPMAVGGAVAAGALAWMLAKKKA